MGSYEKFSAERAAEIINQHKDREGPTLPILHELQETFGHVPDEAVVMIAQALNVTRAEVHGCVTFYHDFKKEVPGRRILKICRAESCQAAGGEALAAQAARRLGVAFGDTTADKRVTLEPVYCLGLCHSSPTAMLDDDVYAMLDEEKMDTLCAEAER